MNIPKRFYIYLIVILGAYHLFSLQPKVLVYYYNKFSSEIDIIVLLLMIFLGTYFFFKFRYRKTLNPQATPQPVEYDDLKDFNVVEIGFLYGASFQRIFVAGIIELWEKGYLHIDILGEKVSITVFNIPRNNSYMMVLQNLFNKREVVPGDVINISNFQYSSDVWLLAGDVGDNFLTQHQLKKGHRNTKNKRHFLFWFFILGLIVIRIAFFLNIVFGFFLIFIFILGYSQITDILFKGQLTKKGKKIYSHLYAYKKYLSKIGEERFKYEPLEQLNPQTHPDLAYVILFGFDKKWLKVFSQNGPFGISQVIYTDIDSFQKKS